MFRVRVPYSGVVALIVYAICNSLIYACLSGIAIEVIIGTIIFKKLVSEKEFPYDSFIGQLLIQYTMVPEVGLWNLLNLICARIVSYILAMFMIGWWLIMPVLLYLLTIIHYIPNSETPTV